VNELCTKIEPTGLIGEDEDDVIEYFMSHKTFMPSSIFTKMKNFGVVIVVST